MEVDWISDDISFKQDSLSLRPLDFLLPDIGNTSHKQNTIEKLEIQTNKKKNIKKFKTKINSKFTDAQNRKKHKPKKRVEISHIIATKKLTISTKFLWFIWIDVLELNKSPSFSSKIIVNIHIIIIPTRSKAHSMRE